MKSNNSSTDLDVEFSDYYIYIHSIGFSGSYSKSKNGQYIIAWKDGFFSADEKDIDEDIETEGIGVFIKVIEKAIEDGGTLEWKDRFLKAIEKEIYRVGDAEWMDEFFKIIDKEIDEGSKAEWKDRFIEALVKNVDEVTEATLQKIDEMSEAELKASIIVEEGEFDEDIETDWKNWQKGKIALLKDEKVIFQDELERPNAGKVANNGTFIINDWTIGEGSKGTFLAFASSGQQVIQHLFSANLYTNGLSDDGQYAICQLYQSETTDRNTIALFDLESGKLLWQKVPETWVADAFEFDTEGNAINLVYENGTKFKYSLSGEFLDKEKWYQHRIQHGTGFELIKIAEGLLTATRNSEAESVAKEALNLYLLAADRLKDSPFFRSQTYRKIGEIYESLHDIGNAIINYELALKLNPNVGVKKKLQALKDKKFL
jgi:tetratricopeptide (TPR) repeat protein